MSIIRELRLIVSSSYYIVLSIALKAEAINSLNVAVELKNAGKLEKAMKIIEHCISLAPFDPDVLNSYGEFLEDIQNDVVGADQMYFRVRVGVFINFVCFKFV